jgi:hypothetical protein
MCSFLITSMFARSGLMMNRFRSFCTCIWEKFLNVKETGQVHSGTDLVTKPMMGRFPVLHLHYGIQRPNVR